MNEMPKKEKLVISYKASDEKEDKVVSGVANNLKALGYEVVGIGRHPCGRIVSGAWHRRSTGLYLAAGATTVVGPGGSRSRWASGSAPGAVSPGQTRSTDPTKARSPSLVQQ